MIWKSFQLILVLRIFRLFGTLGQLSPLTDDTRLCMVSWVLGLQVRPCMDVEFELSLWSLYWGKNESRSVQFDFYFISRKPSMWLSGSSIQNGDVASFYQRHYHQSSIPWLPCHLEGCSQWLCLRHKSQVPSCCGNVYSLRSWRVCAVS